MAPNNEALLESIKAKLNAPSANHSIFLRELDARFTKEAQNLSFYAMVMAEITNTETVPLDAALLQSVYGLTTAETDAFSVKLVDRQVDRVGTEIEHEIPFLKPVSIHEYNKSVAAMRRVSKQLASTLTPVNSTASTITSIPVFLFVAWAAVAIAMFNAPALLGCIVALCVYAQCASGIVRCTESNRRKLHDYTKQCSQDAGLVRDVVDARLQPNAIGFVKQVTSFGWSIEGLHDKTQTFRTAPNSLLRVPSRTIRNLNGLVNFRFESDAYASKAKVANMLMMAVLGYSAYMHKSLMKQMQRVMKL